MAVCFGIFFHFFGFLHYCVDSVKLASTTFWQIFIFHQMIALQKLWKIIFISSKKLFLFRDIQIFVFPSFPLFLPVSVIALELDPRWILKVHDVINCLNKNLIRHFVWYLGKEKRYGIETLSIDRVLNEERFYGKIMQKIIAKSLPQTPFLFY